MELHGLKVIDQAKDHPNLQGIGCHCRQRRHVPSRRIRASRTAWNQARVIGIADIQKHQWDEYYQGLCRTERISLSPRTESCFRRRCSSPIQCPSRGITLPTGTKRFLLSQQHLLKHDFSIDDWLDRARSNSKVDKRPISIGASSATRA